MQTEFPLVIFLLEEFDTVRLSDNSDTALFILSFAGNYRRIVNLPSGFLQSFNPPLTTDLLKKSDPSSAEASGTPSLQTYF